MANQRQKAMSRAIGTRRTSISLPAEVHRELEQIAKQKKVSFAWVVRDAIDAYIQNQYPLFVKRDNL